MVIRAQQNLYLLMEIVKQHVKRQKLIKIVSYAKRHLSQEISNTSESANMKDNDSINQSRTSSPVILNHRRTLQHITKYR